MVNQRVVKTLSLLCTFWAVTLTTNLSLAAVAKTITVKQPNGLVLDARSYYKKRTPTYAVADFVYVDHWNTDIGQTTWDDVWQGQYPIAFINDEPDGWFVTDGVDIYQLTYQSSTRATVKTHLSVERGSEEQMTMHNFQSSGSYTVNTTFQLKKIGGRWWITNINDIANQLQRLISNR